MRERKLIMYCTDTLYQYSRGRAQWPRSIRSPSVAVWRHLRPTGIQNVFPITSKF